MIHKARVKKSYYKDLAEEGYATGMNGGELGVRGSAAAKALTKGKGKEAQDNKQSDFEANEQVEGSNPSSSSTSSRKQQNSSSVISTPAVPVKKPRLTSPEIATIRERKVAERKEWGQRSSRGQPKLGGRVEMLLSRIKKSMA